MVKQNIPEDIHLDSLPSAAKLATDSTGKIIEGTETFYGSMYNDNADYTVVISGGGVDTEVDGGFTAGELNGITFPDDHYLVISTAGKYLITYSMSILTASVANKTVEGFIMLNGTRQAPGSSHAEVSPGGSNRPETVNGSAVLDLAANAQVSLGVRNHDDGTDIVVNHSSLTVVALKYT